MPPFHNESGFMADALGSASSSSGYQKVADAVAINSNHCRNNRPYQNTSCSRHPYLYQKLSKKATQLRLLGMTYGQIARSLHINRKTATKACKCEGKEVGQCSGH